MFTRLDLLLTALVQLGLYVVVLLVALALLSRPAEAAGLIFGERLLRLASRVLAPVTAALARTTWSASAAEGVDRFTGSVDALVGRVLGDRGPDVARRIWQPRDDKHA